MSATAAKPDDLLKELSVHWRELGSGDAADGLLRACSMTLTCFADDEEDAQSLGGVLASLMREHPSRLVVVRLKDGEDELTARVSAQCWKPFGHGQQICCEQVEVTASMDRLADVVSIVAPLAAPDLPRVVLLRSARVVRAGALRKILRLGDKIIVDSSRVGAPGFGELGGLLDAGHTTGDLAWTRLTPIRALLAQLLENRNPKAIVIEYPVEHARHEVSPEARYLQAWLQTALRDCAISLRSGMREDCSGIAVVRVDQDLVVRVCKGGAEYETGSMTQRASMPDATEEQLLSEELGIVVHDRVFECALNHITA